MANFEAKTKEEMHGITKPAAPGAKVPEANPNGLEYLGVHGFFTYKDPDHTYADFLREGYFDAICAQNPRSYLGALIIFDLGGGKPDREDWVAGVARIVRVKSMRAGQGAEPIRHTKISAWRFPKFTVGAHGGEMDDGAGKPGKAA